MMFYENIKKWHFSQKVPNGDFYKIAKKYIDYGTETEVSAPLNRKFNIFTKFSMRGFETNFYKRNKYVLLCIFA